MKIGFAQDIPRLLEGSGFIFSCRLFGAVAAFTTQVLLARWMGAAELGVFVLAFSWMIILATASSAGFPVSAIRFVGEGLAHDDHESIRGFVRYGNWQLIALSLFLSVSAALVVLFSTSEAPATAAFLAAFAAVPIFSLLTFNTSVANAFSWFKLSFVPTNVIRPLLFLIAVYLAWSLGIGLDATVVLQLSWLVILCVMSGVLYLVHRDMAATLTPGPSRYARSMWLRTSLPLLIVSVFTNFFPEIMVVLIGWYLPTEDIAIYNASFRVALLIGFGLNAVDAYISPQAVQLYAKRELGALQRVVNAATRVRFAGALAALLVLSVIGKWVLGLFGDEFVAGYPVMMVLVLAQLVRAGVGPVTRLLSITGHQNKCLSVFATAFLAAILLVALLVPRYGINGAAVTAFATILLWCIWSWILVVRHLGIKPSIFPA